MHPKKLFSLVIWIIFFEIIGAYLGYVTKSDIMTWYNSLHKSSLTPPGFVFSIVWTILYALLAFIAWKLSINSSSQNKQIKFLFSVQMLMNWLWTPIFFRMHLINLSTAWIIILTLINVILIYKTRKSHKEIALTMTPYVIWLGFASYLNLTIALLN